MNTLLTTSQRCARLRADLIDLCSLGETLAVCCISAGRVHDADIVKVGSAAIALRCASAAAAAAAAGDRVAVFLRTADGKPALGLFDGPVRWASGDEIGIAVLPAVAVEVLLALVSARR